MSRDLSSDDLRAIDAAVDSVRDRLTPEDRFDLRQDLAIRLLSWVRPSADLKACLRNWAFDWTVDFLKSEARHRELLKELHKVGRPVGYRIGSNWTPNWYKPHKDAEEFAPFACEGARVMACKPGQRGKRDS